jgi:hypothetical protein
VKQGALASSDTGGRALVIGNLADKVGYRTERPLANGLGSGEIRMEDVTGRVVREGVSSIDFDLHRGGQVPSILQIRQDQFGLERVVGIGLATKAVCTRVAPIVHVDTKTGLDVKAAIPELPAQFHRNDVGIERAGTLGVNGRTNALHDKWLHEDSVIGRTQEGPAGNEQEALNVNGRLNSDMIYRCRAAERRRR